MKCSVPECEKPGLAKELCRMHYYRIKRTGQVGDAKPLVIVTAKPNKGCAAEGCGRPHFAHGFCRSHEWRTRNWGGVRADVPINDRNMENNGQWSGGVTVNNGRAKVKCKDHPNADRQGYVWRAHLVAEKVASRFIQPGEVVHHKNRNTLDDSPENLEIMTKEQHDILHIPDRNKANQLRYEHNRLVNIS